MKYFICSWFLLLRGFRKYDSVLKTFLYFSFKGHFIRTRTGLAPPSVTLKVRWNALLVIIILYHTELYPSQITSKIMIYRFLDVKR